MAFYQQLMDVVCYEKYEGSVVNIVSGLPRSGTSMMMQLLHRGGMSVLTDSVRQSDSRNPFGYMELEATKTPLSYDQWLQEANGKVVKVVSRFVPFLPSTYCYNVVFMCRDLNAVIRSQRDMAQHYSDTLWNENDAGKLAEIYQKHLGEVVSWIHSRPNIRLHQVSYEDILISPREVLNEVADFFKPYPLNVDNMLEGVSGKLDHSSQTRSRSHEQS